ncbi:MAG: RidA family protein [Cyanobacteria bacterium P01_D01_bin.44]
MTFERHFTGTPWESKVGYCRALRAGKMIFVSGTAPVAEDGSTFAPYDAYAQTHRCFEIIQKALESMNSTLADVVRTRLYVTDIGRYEEIARAHQECFGDHPPASTLVEVKGLINPDMLIEIEADAMVTESPSRWR